MKKTLFISSLAILVILAIIFFGPQVLREARVTGDGFSLHVDVARTQLEKVRGLSGRESLGDNEGMLFVFDTPSIYGFWMKGMRFPIDIVWIDGNTVVGVTERVDPQVGVREEDLVLYYSPAFSDRVLELRSGRASELGIQEGMILTISK